MYCIVPTYEKLTKKWVDLVAIQYTSSNLKLGISSYMYITIINSHERNTTVGNVFQVLGIETTVGTCTLCTVILHIRDIR